MRTPPMITNRLALGLGALLFMAACSWNVPADPGLNMELRGASAWSQTAVAPTPRHEIDPGAANDTKARGVYLRKCSQCHEAIQPSALAAHEWPAAVNKYAPRAGLYGAERQQVLAWLMANAAP